MFRSNVLRYKVIRQAKKKTLDSQSIKWAKEKKQLPQITKVGRKKGGEQSTLKAHARNHTQEVKTEQSLQALNHLTSCLDV